MAVAAWADLASLANDLSKAEGTGITLAAADIIQQSAQRIQSTAQSLAPIKSGRLRQSISIRYPEPLKAIVGPQVEYGKYQEFGTGTRGEFPTKPYEIRPKGGRKFLSFTVNGKKVVVRRVTHPGVPPRPFMRPAIEQVLGELTTSLADKGALLITKGPNA